MANGKQIGWRRGISTRTHRQDTLADACRGLSYLDSDGGGPRSADLYARGTDEIQENLVARSLGLVSR